MKRTIWTLTALGTALGTVLGVAGPAVAACTPNGGYAQLNQAQVEALVGTGMACYPAAGPPWTNQEYHSGGITSAGGNITDYKKGPGDPRDPTAQIGIYTIDANGVVTYTYGSGHPFPYTVWGTQTSGSGTYDFCNGATPLPGQVKIIASTGTPRSCGAGGPAP
jgi:hypothetical protein